MESTPIYHGSSYESSQPATITTIKSDVADDEIHLLVDLPEAARVFVNDNPTTSTGGSRKYVSKSLERGSSYRFQVRAELDVDGRTVSQERTVVLVPGSKEAFAFRFADSTPVAETVLKLNVPADAKVTLAGNSTKSQGESRVYRTKELTAGQVWEDYTIFVEWNGKTREKSIRLIGGDELEVSFNFNESEALALN